MTKVQWTGLTIIWLIFTLVLVSGDLIGQGP
jgi:hypothetical protein